MIKIYPNIFKAVLENGNEIPLTNKSIQLIIIMNNNKGKAFSYKELNLLLSKTEFCDQGLSRQHIYNTNKIFGFKLIIRNKFGGGYILSEKVEIENVLPEAVRFASECYELKAEDVLLVYNTWVELQNKQAVQQVFRLLKWHKIGGIGSNQAAYKFAVKWLKINPNYWNIGFKLVKLDAIICN